MRILKFITFIFGFLFIGNVFADTDGFYCLGKDYVAIESRGIDLKSLEPNITVITISAAGELNKFEFLAPSDKNRFLACQHQKILSSDGYVIDLTNLDAPSMSKGDVDVNTVFSSMHLPSLSESKSIKLDVSDASHLYYLMLGYNVQDPEQKMLLHYVSARVVKVTKFGTINNSKSLAEGIRLETVDPY
ncbi:hypothetical protein VST7929_02976 [Vibrio stylophorae]|uniref:Uncharacterized protein n=1 Tax=Vibrio stylophorae TaxID=659351 RepID=A0ABN8DVH0_9VIBR|nr:hypothetical protein [Vibrio stylophorae]CAH0535403.1 hypothetical protein VST7929_02976 [Vibrio stylophorae]